MFALKNFKSVFVLVCSFTLGVGIFFSTFNKVTKKRDPAALNGKIYQISDLTSNEIKEQLHKKIKINPTIDGLKNITFSGFSSALCKSYSTIEVEFSAEGIMVAGEAPSMKVSYPCEAGQDPAEMASLTLPIGKILGEKPRNAEFKFDGYNAVITTLNSADEWPRQWVLKRVEFKNLAGGENKQVTFNRGPASVPEDRPIVIEF